MLGMWRNRNSHTQPVTTNWYNLFGKQFGEQFGDLPDTADNEHTERPQLLYPIHKHPQVRMAGLSCTGGLHGGCHRVSSEL